MPRFLAIDADAHGLVVAAGTVRGSGVKLDQTLVWSEDARPLSPATAKAIGTKLKELLKQAGIAPAPALVGVGRDRVILKEVKYPPAAAADEPAVVRFQAVKELTDSPDEVVLDYSPLAGADTPAGERRALVAFLRREMLAAARVMCEAAGLKLAAVTPRPFAAAAALQRALAAGAVPPPEAADTPVAVVTLTEAGGEFTVVRGGAVRFARSVSPQAVASEPALVAELRRNLTVYAGQAGGDQVEAVYLAEADAGGDAWAGRLAAALPVPVHPFDPLADSPAAELIPPPLRGRFAGPVGLLAAKAAAGPLPINFHQPRQPRASSDPKRNRTLAAVLVGVLLLGAGAIGGYLMVKDAEDRVRALRRQVTQVDEELKQWEPDAKRLKAADEFEAREVVWLDEFYDVTDRFPDIERMKMVMFQGKSIPPPTERERTQLEAQGKSLPVGPVARVQITVSAPSGELPDRFVSGLDSRYHKGAVKKGGGGAATGSRQQTFTIDAGVMHRNPVEYTRRLTVSPPKPPEAPKEAPKQPADDDGFGGGFAP